MNSASTLPTVAQLRVFLDHLRRAAYRVGPNQIAEAEKILLLAHADAPDGPFARRLKTMLAPVVATTPAQQEDFYCRFDAVLDEIRVAPAANAHAPTGTARMIPQAPSSQPTQSRRRQPSLAWWTPFVHASSQPTQSRRRRPALYGALGALLLIVAGFGWLQLERQPEPSPPHAAAVTPSATGASDKESLVTARLNRRLSYELARAVLLAFPVLVFAGWLVWRWRRRLLWLERQPSLREADPAALRLGGGDQPLFEYATFTATAADMRRHRRVLSRDLDIERTIPATMDAGGSFTPVWRTIPRSPDYLFLVERESAHDHVAAIVSLALDRLKDEGVFTDRYYFRGDPRWLVSDDADPKLVPIAELAGRFGQHRLAVVGTTDGFFEPLTNELDPRVEQALLSWKQRYLLSTKPMEAWSWRELALVEHTGFDLATALPSGLEALAGRAAAEPEEQGQMLEGVVVSRPARIKVSDAAVPATITTGRTKGRREALIADGELWPGPAPDVTDIRDLGELLEDPKAGNFAVQYEIWHDPDQDAVDRISEFLLADWREDDVVLVVFCADGMDEEAGARAAAQLRNSLARCRAGRQVYILDGLPTWDIHDLEAISGTDTPLSAVSAQRELIHYRSRRQQSLRDGAPKAQRLAGSLLQALNGKTAAAAGVLRVRGLFDLLMRQARELEPDGLLPVYESVGASADSTVIALWDGVTPDPIRDKHLAAE